MTETLKSLDLTLPNRSRYINPLYEAYLRSRVPEIERVIADFSSEGFMPGVRMFGALRDIYMRDIMRIERLKRYRARNDAKITSNGS